MGRFSTPPSNSDPPSYPPLGLATGADELAHAVALGLMLIPGGREELRSTISEAFKVDGPTIVDCVVAPDELPNFPHIELGQAERYAAAKISATSELFGA